MKIRTVGDELFHEDRKKYRYMKTLIVGFRNFANELKNAIVWGGSHMGTIQKQQQQQK